MYIADVHICEAIEFRADFKIRDCAVHSIVSTEKWFSFKNTRAGYEIPDIYIAYSGSESYKEAYYTKLSMVYYADGLWYRKIDFLIYPISIKLIYSI